MDQDATVFIDKPRRPGKKRSLPSQEATYPSDNFLGNYLFAKKDYPRVVGDRRSCIS